MHRYLTTQGSENPDAPQLDGAELSIAELHQVIQILTGWDDDHLHRFRIHGRDYGIAYIGGPNFSEDAAAVPLSWFGFRPTERFLYEYAPVAQPASATQRRPNADWALGLAERICSPE